MNTYFSLVLSSMPGSKQRGRRMAHRPRPVPAVVRPRGGLHDNPLDEASDLGSVDGARDMSMSYAKVLEALTAADTIATQARPPRRVALHAEVSATADTMAPQARRPLLVEAPLAVSNATPATLKNVAASGRKQTSPLSKLSARAA